MIPMFLRTWMQVRIWDSSSFRIHTSLVPRSAKTSAKTQKKTSKLLLILFSLLLLMLLSLASFSPKRKNLITCRNTLGDRCWETKKERKMDLAISEISGSFVEREDEIAMNWLSLSHVGTPSCPYIIIPSRNSIKAKRGIENKEAKEKKILSWPSVPPYFQNFRLHIFVISCLNKINLMSKLKFLGYPQSVSTNCEIFVGSGASSLPKSNVE